MNIVTSKSTFKTLRPGDQEFVISNGMMVANRAGFEIKRECPREYKLILQDCIDRGWISPVATITEREYIFMGLSK